MGTMETTASFVLHRDAEVLRNAVRSAVISSPRSFLTTIESVEAKPLEGWVAELQSATWVVAERGGAVHKQVVGVAASRHPDPDADSEDPAAARYIDSVWVAPGLRGRRVGERLLKHLLAAEHWSNPRVRQFLLWVFDDNDPAIRLYERIGFIRMLEQLMDEGKTEIKYCLDFNPEVHTMLGLFANAPQPPDRIHHTVSYRLLGRPGLSTARREAEAGQRLIDR
jgi:ribosomal protein S18 acetylase RimI-like enzyme